jgi:hypothetical protein
MEGIGRSSSDPNVLTRIKDLHRHCMLERDE